MVDNARRQSVEECYQESVRKMVRKGVIPRLAGISLFETGVSDRGWTPQKLGTIGDSMTICFEHLVV